MKKIITMLAIVVAIAGVFVAKANDKKRVFAVSQAYYNGSNSLFTFTVGSSPLTTTSGTNKEASIQIGTGINAVVYRLYENTGSSGPLFVP